MRNAIGDSEEEHKRDKGESEAEDAKKSEDGSAHEPHPKPDCAKVEKASNRFPRVTVCHGGILPQKRRRLRRVLAKPGFARPQERSCHEGFLSGVYVQGVHE